MCKSLRSRALSLLRSGRHVHSATILHSLCKSLLRLATTAANQVLVQQQLQ